MASLITGDLCLRIYQGILLPVNFNRGDIDEEDYPDHITNWDEE